MRIGLLGGTFDPVHKGHLALAKSALTQLKLDQVYLVLSPRSPFKLDHAITPAPQRLRFLRRALKGKPKTSVGLWEMKRRGPSYTIDTLTAYKKRHPKHHVFLLLGSDALKGFKKWKKAAKIQQLATLVVAPRPGTAVPRNPSAIVLKGKFPNISSTEIRRKKK